MKLFYFLLIVFFNNHLNAEPITVGVLSSIAVGIGILCHKSISCLFNECCQPYSQWMPLNMTMLEENLNTYLHGQHLVKEALMGHLKYHILNKEPKKALLLSFNGMPGTGKNFVTSMIANSLYKNGMKSKFVHLYLSSVHFPLEKNVDEYKTALQKQVTASVKLCPRSIFIFDEVQDMPATLLDSLRSFVDTHESIDGVDYRKSIFILLSNSGGVNINTKMVQVISSGRQRESLTLHEMEAALVQDIYKMKNDGLRQSKLISNNLITAFVPFLPLEKRHVRLCIIDHFKQHKEFPSAKRVEEVLAMLRFEEVGGFAMALQGCKRIEEKIQLLQL